MLMLLAPLTAFAQKFGKVNTQTVVQTMTDYGKAQGELLAEVVADGGIDEVSCRAGIIVEDTVRLVVGIDTVGEVVNVPDGEFESAMGVGSIIVELLVVTVRLHSAPQSEAEVVVVVGDGDVIVEGQSL